MEEKSLQKIGGVSAIFEALIYISAFIVYGGLLPYPAPNASANEKLQFLTDNQLILSILNFTSYILFGILLVSLVQALHQRLKSYAPMLSKIASVFGFIWMGLVIASGMIANIGLNQVIETGNTDPEKAMLIYSIVGIVTEGLGGGNEIVGGIWVLLLSFMAWRSNNFNKATNLLGFIVGIAGILTIYPLEIFKEVFGLGQIIWFLAIGITMIRKP